MLACGEKSRTPPGHVDGSPNQLVPKVVVSLTAHGPITQVAAGVSGSLFLAENGQALQALVSGGRVDCRHATRSALGEPAAFVGLVTAVGLG